MKCTICIGHIEETSGYYYFLNKCYCPDCFDKNDPSVSMRSIFRKHPGEKCDESSGTRQIKIKILGDDK